MRWDTIDYTHAFFILPISLGLIWLKRDKLKELHRIRKDNSSNVISLFFIIFGGLLFIFGQQQDYILFQTFSLIPILFGLTGYLYGPNISKTLAFPFLYLLLLVPPPVGILDSITFPMRYGISVAAESVLGLINYPVSRDGLMLTIGYQDIFMGEPCSGFRSLITMISLVLVYVYLVKGHMLKKLILTSFIVPMALLGNLVRVITLCLITFYFGEEAGQGFFHNFSGIVIFIITILGLMGMETLLKFKDEKA